MNHVIILAGGIGQRMKMSVPKQYIDVNGMPVFMYSYLKFANNPAISSIVIVLDDTWRPFVDEKIKQSGKNTKTAFAKSGNSRQHSVFNGMKVLAEYANEDDIVLIHDSVRPLFPESIIESGIEACKIADGAIPVIPIKDATYRSKNGNFMSEIIPREELYSGQSPEFFSFKRFFEAHKLFNDMEMQSIRGCSELAFRAGMSVKLINGAEQNFKITTKEDLEAFKIYL